MEKIAWDESFSVGVRVLDAQHKQIVIMVNTLIEMNEAKVNSEIISDTLTKMTKYASDHLKEKSNTCSNMVIQSIQYKKATPGI